jgi:hypothetical protein
MSDDHGRRAGNHTEAERSGAFVARVWRDNGGLRARIRSNIHLPDPEDVDDFTGDADRVAEELVDRFRRWIEAFASDRT